MSRLIAIPIARPKMLIKEYPFCLKNVSNAYFKIITPHFYSYFKVSTGLILEICIAFEVVIKNASNIASIPEITNINQLMGVLYA